MLENFLAYIHDENLIEADETCLLAVSGGLDSVVMTRLFAEAKLPFAIAHCNFNLREEESAEDERFVRKLARKAKVPFHSKSFDTLAFAEEHKISTQMAARSLRYAWFEELMQEHGYPKLALAHHQNDLVETILLNLTRGTGLAGFHGIAAKRGNIIRPLLFTTRDELFDYVTEKQIIWREDSSNASEKYARNKIRHNVIPVLQELNPALERTAQQTAEKVSAAERLLQEHIARLRELLVQEQAEATYLQLEGLLEESEPAYLLSELLAPMEFSYAQAKDMLQVLDSEGTQSGKQFFSPTHRLVIDRGQLVITKASLVPFQSAELPQAPSEFRYREYSLTLEEKAGQEYDIKADNWLAALDADKLEFPLEIRSWRTGDWFCPLGMNKKKKLSDFMIDAKIPLNLKERILVITSGDSIVWIVGQRIDNRFKVTPTTEKVLEIHCNVQPV